VNRQALKAIFWRDWLHTKPGLEGIYSINPRSKLKGFFSKSK
jgi:hypothetical protein